VEGSGERLSSNVCVLDLWLVLFSEPSPKGIPRDYSADVYTTMREAGAEGSSDPPDVLHVDEHEDDALVATAARIANEV
jgi:hypothetical protein